MTIDELRTLCQEAARDLVTRHEGAIPAAVVVPLPGSTQVATLADFPHDDEDRHRALSHFAADRMVPAGAPCYGFIAEAELDAGEGAIDVVMVVFGARQRGSWVTAAPVGAAGLGQFSDAEQLDPTALPFLQPLQHAADLAQGGGDDVLGAAGSPTHAPEPPSRN
jgi:hypothetical protein